MATCSVLVACATKRVQQDLARTFVQLQDAGKLPGLPPEAEAEIHMQPTANFERVTYPCTRDIFVMKIDDTSCYTYHFLKDTKDSKWQLTKAWVTTQNGERSALKVR